jgi:hypothetical protein
MRRATGHALRGCRRGSMSRNDKQSTKEWGDAAIGNGLSPLDIPFVTLLGTAPGGQWGGFDKSLARVVAHALPVSSRRKI